MTVLLAPKHHLLDGPFDYKVPFRNSILQSLYPDVRIEVLAVSRDIADRDDMEARLAQGRDGLQLDFATGAKKQGEFIATDRQVASRFWTTPEQMMAYGGNLLTYCTEPPKHLGLRVLVVEDGEYGTGDCHAKLDAATAEVCFGCADRAAQFRLAAEKYLAKGTMITYAPWASSMNADLVLPRSAFKSAEKPACGMHYWHDATLGIAAWSKKLRVKVSYTVLQWFSKRTIEHDVMPHVEKSIAQLLTAGRSVQAAVELLRLDKTKTDATLVDVLTADVHDRLNSHPWVVRGITQMLRRHWLHLALGGGLKATGLLGLPDDSLPTGCVSTPDLPYGAFIAFRYPARSWADLRLWRNVRKREHRAHHGVVWMSHATAKLVAGDFDGDIYAFLPAKQFSAMTAEIRHWRKTRQAPKVDVVKTRLASSIDRLPQVAMDNVDNMVGLITYFITLANAMKRLDLVAELALELQIAVDKFKYDLRHDQEKIDAISEQLEPIAWLADRKDHEVFRDRPIEVDDEATDTISYLARRVARAWEPPTHRAAPIETFVGLFPPEHAHTEAARELNRHYAQLVAEAISSNAPDGLTPTLDTLKEWANNCKDPAEWAAAIWHAVHRKSSRGTGSLAFHAFPEQVIAQLQAPPRPPDKVSIIGLRYHQYADDLASLDGQSQTVIITTAVLNDKVRQLALIGERTLGLVSTETPICNGRYDLQLTWNKCKVVYGTP